MHLGMFLLVIQVVFEIEFYIRLSIAHISLGLIQDSASGLPLFAVHPSTSIVVILSILVVLLSHRQVVHSLPHSIVIMPIRHPLMPMNRPTGVVVVYLRCPVI